MEMDAHYKYLKKLNRNFAALKHLLRSPSIEVMPQWVSFQNTHVCNLRCPHCQTHGTAEGRNHCNDMSLNMDVMMLKRVAEEVLPFADEFTLTLTGEPLATPDLENILLLLSPFGAKLDLITNGTLLTKEKLRLLIPVLKRVQISVDGATPPTFESIRLGASFRKVLNNIKLLTLTCSRLPMHLKPEVSLSFTIMGSNIKELPDIVDIAALLDVPVVNGAFVQIFYPNIADESVELYKPLYNACYTEATDKAKKLGITLSLPSPFSGINHGRTAIKNSGKTIMPMPPYVIPKASIAPQNWLDMKRLEQDAEGLAAVILGNQLSVVTADEISGMKNDVDKMQRNFNLELQNHHELLQNISHVRKSRIRYCDYLQRCTYVFPSGDVSPCCVVGAPVLGNLKFGCMRDVWNGAAYNDFRNRFFSDNPVACCRGCKFIKDVPAGVFLDQIQYGG
jgi:sulfatase maturation enzyme AslB (radical SAM superfamily)